ncbi:hypothetical protein BGZ97_011869 [Linnemannia gamsii]|uniref:Uncharacterized protein n=1 Tax=Linnemannia gamsii TaxID=64522 RepID=A0A9P6R568_9FUNG|nr:hypothetical protein BGZ97_011869 [Linnemannia gamsii]
MARQSPIPPECLHIVIEHLSLDNDTYSLTTLLRVNRFFAYATLPFLYRDPFTLVSKLKSSSKRFTFINRLYKEMPSQLNRNTMLLTRTLLKQAPLDKITDLLRAVCFTQQSFDGDFDPWPNAPSDRYTHVLEYLPHVTHLPSLKFPSNTGRNNNPRLVAYLKTTGFFDRCRALDLYASIFQPTTQKARFDMPMLLQEFHHQLLWALCVPESTRILQILLSDVHQVLDRVERFKLLETFEVSIDKHLGIMEYMSQYLPPKDKALEDARRVEQDRHLETMVGFVQKHTSIHKGVLQSADLHDNRTLVGSNLPATYGYQQRMTKCLPLVHNPTALMGSRDFKKFLDTSEYINLSYLESFSNMLCCAHTNAILAQIPPFFHRCRSLKSIYTVIFGDDPFAWAVQERREHNAQVARNQDNALTPQLSLVPVKEVVLKFGGQIRGQPIDSIAHGFGATLESYTMAGWRKFWPHQHEAAVFGQGWSLPRLHTLTATTARGRLTLHPDALVGCPAVKKVTLKDSVDAYPAVGTPSWTPAYLPLLRTLELSGSPARLFHPNSLHSAISLEALTLAQNEGNLHEREYDFDDVEAGNFDIDNEGEEEAEEDNGEQDLLHPTLDHLFPLSEQQQAETATTPLPRPRWTWDWHLPHLKKLNLCAEFAFSFQFRMLRLTPSLTHLCLTNIVSEGDHERTVTVDELRDHQRTEGETGEGFICLPSLTNLMLVTRWTIGPQFWQTLFRKVMPSIAVIREAKCSGFTLQDWIEATLGLENLRFAGTMLKVRYEEPLELGLSALDEYQGARGRPQFFFRDAFNVLGGDVVSDEAPLSAVDDDLDDLQLARYTSEVSLK